MNDNHKTKSQLIKELEDLRRQVAEQQKSETERKRTEGDIKNLAKFPSENPNPVLRLNHEGIVLYANEASKALLQDWQCAVGGYAPAFWCNLSIEAIKEQSQRTLDVQLGEHFYAFDITPIPNTYYANLYGRDITERKRAEDENRRNEARLESLLKISQYRADSTQELLDFALEEAITLTNSKIGYVYRYNETKEEFILNTWSKEVMKQCTIAEPQTIYHLDKTGIWGEAVRQARPIIVNDFQAPHSLKRGYPEGHAPLYKYMTVPVFSDNRIVGVVGVANKETDYDTSDVRQLTLLMDSVWKIFERKRTDEALRDSEQRYRSLFESMDEGFALCEMIYDLQGKPIDFRYLVVNPAFGKLTGLPIDKVMGRTVKEVIPGIEPFWIESFDSVVQSGQGERFDNQVAELGKQYEVYAWSSAVGQFAVVFTDVTERKKLEKELRRSRDQLEIRVRERTAELALTNEGLIIEIEERQRAEEALLESKIQLQLLASQLVTAQENERKRIALEVHDVLGSSLSAIKFKVEDVLHRIDQSSTMKISEHLEALIPLIRDTIGEARRIQTDLRPPLLDDLGILPTLSWFCRRFETIYSGIKVEQAVTIQEEDVPEHLKISLFRITQEAMNNIGKYAQADSVYMGLQKVDGSIELLIKDNGVGFDPESLSAREISKKGLGLTSMKERVEFSGGSFSIDSAKGKGTVIRAVWPV